MLVDVRFLSVREARVLTPGKRTVIISILDEFEEHNRPDHLAQFRDHLVMNFVDTSEKEGEPHWPDQMTPEEHLAACTWDIDRAPELSDAQAIIDFLRKHHADPEPIRLVVHCHGGISRSAAVAQWVATAYGIPLPQLGDGVHELDGANPRVMRLLDKAAGRI